MSMGTCLPRALPTPERNPRRLIRLKPFILGEHMYREANEINTEWDGEGPVYNQRDLPASDLELQTLPTIHKNSRFILMPGPGHLCGAALCWPLHEYPLSYAAGAYLASASYPGF